MLVLYYIYLILNSFPSTIYEKSGKLRHSCLPNTMITVSADDPTQSRTLLASKDIKKGEMLTHGYGGNIIIGTLGRRALLFNDYNFWCTCFRCSDPTELGTFYSAIKCTNPSCDGYLLQEKPLDWGSAWKCTYSNCNCTKTYSYVQSLLLNCNRKVDQTNCVEGMIALMDALIKLKLHPNHYLVDKARHKIIKQVYMSMVQSIGFDEQYSGCHHAMKLLDISSKCLGIANAFLPEKCPERGNEIRYY